MPQNGGSQIAARGQVWPRTRRSDGRERGAGLLQDFLHAARVLAEDAMRTRAAWAYPNTDEPRFATPCHQPPRAARLQCRTLCAMCVRCNLPGGRIPPDSRLVCDVGATSGARMLLHAAGEPRMLQGVPTLPCCWHSLPQAAGMPLPRDWHAVAAAMPLP